MQAQAHRRLAGGGADGCALRYALIASQTASIVDVALWRRRPACGAASSRGGDVHERSQRLYLHTVNFFSKAGSMPLRQRESAVRTSLHACSLRSPSNRAWIDDVQHHPLLLGVEVAAALRHLPCRLARELDDFFG